MCGGCGIIDKVDGFRIANDIHSYLISMWRALTENQWEPPTEISLEEYTAIRQNKEGYPSELVGFVGFGCSYSGKWWGGYARGKDDKGRERNYCLESHKNVLKQIRTMHNIVWENKPYDEVDIPKNSIVYADIPYEGTTKYKDSFDHSKFWEWAREQSHNHYLYVSEYKAPSDFKCLWYKQVNNSLMRDTGSKKGVEKLFVMEGGKSWEIHQI